MAGVMDGRRLKFSPMSWDPRRYEVAAIALSLVDPQPWLVLGEVVRDVRSTDSRIAGTRFRRPGKGAVVWRAEVPREQWDRSGTGAIPAGQLVQRIDRRWELQWRGQAWDRRQDAALALAAWYDQRSGTEAAG
ncbi:MAG: hypothetical protein ACRDMZ_14460 [Solirubrobacteraceae bacterium]